MKKNNNYLPKNIEPIYDRKICKNKHISRNSSIIKMKIYLQNTESGLIPCDNDDYDSRKRLKIGEIYEVSIRKTRNYQFHKKYFQLINIAFEYLGEGYEEYFKTKELFRKSIEIAAGYCDRIYNIETGEFIDTPKSIAFDKLDELEFREIYNNVRHVLFNTVLKDVPVEEFEQNLREF